MSSETDDPDGGKPRGKNLLQSIRRALVTRQGDLVERESEDGGGTRGISRGPLPPGTATPEAIAKLKSDLGLDASGFVQFLGVAESLADSIPDEATRYKAAVKVAKKTLAIDIKDLVAEFIGMRTRLKAKAAEFDNNLARISDEKLGPSREDVAQLEAQVTTQQAQLEEQIRTQRELLESYEKQAAEARAKLDAEEAKLAGIAANFKAAHDTVLAEIDGNEAKFKTLLGS